jgi:hypothetical protein
LFVRANHNPGANALLQQCRNQALAYEAGSACDKYRWG